MITGLGVTQAVIRRGAATGHCHLDYAKRANITHGGFIPVQKCPRLLVFQLTGFTRSSGSVDSCSPISSRQVLRSPRPHTYIYIYICIYTHTYYNYNHITLCYIILCLGPHSSRRRRSRASGGRRPCRSSGASDDRRF